MLPSLKPAGGAHGNSMCCVPSPYKPIILGLGERRRLAMLRMRKSLLDGNYPTATLASRVGIGVRRRQTMLTGRLPSWDT